MIDTSEAFRLADDMGLDLVMVNNGDVPICKLMDYEKHCYEVKKQAKKQKANRSSLKELKIGPGIADNDLRIKAKNASRILGDGDKLKVEITYKGRLIRLISDGINKLNEFSSMVEYPHTVPNPPKIEGNRVYMVIAPTK